RLCLYLGRPRASCPIPLALGDLSGYPAMERAGFMPVRSTGGGTRRAQHYFPGRNTTNLSLPSPRRIRFPLGSRAAASSLGDSPRRERGPPSCFRRAAAARPLSPSAPCARDRSYHPVRRTPVL